MPIVYSVESFSEKPVFVSSLVKATEIARNNTSPSTGHQGDAIIRQHETPKANMDAILSALNGTGWADITTGTVVKTVRNGRAVS